MNTNLEQTLARVIAEDRGRLAASEQTTKQVAILAILESLGWQWRSADEVIPEYPCGKGKVDYCLSIGGRPAVLLEAKRLSEELDNHQEQLLKYAFGEGTSLAVLTNGLVWWFYLPLREGTWEQRRFFAIDLDRQDTAQAAEHFQAFLSRDAVASGDAVLEATRLHESRERDRRIRSTLPLAWKEICEEPDPTVLDLLADRVETLCGRRPEPREASEFLRRSLGAHPVEHTDPPPRPIRVRPAPEPDPRSVLHHPGRKASPKPAPNSITLLGESRSTGTWKDVLVRACEILAEKTPNFDSVLTLRGREHPYFSRDERMLDAPRAIPGTDIHAGTQLSAEAIEKRCHQVLEHLGIHSRELQLNYS